MANQEDRLAESSEYPNLQFEATSYLTLYASTVLLSLALVDLQLHVLVL
jgi:hypothetical protein